MNQLSTLTKGMFTGIVINLTFMVTIFALTSHALNDLELIRGSIRWLWIINLLILGLFALANLGVGKKRINLSVQEDDLPTTRYPFSRLDHNYVIGYGLSAIGLLLIYTFYILWQYPEPRKDEKCAAIQRLIQAIEEVETINPNDPIQVVLDLRERMGNLRKDYYFLYKHMDGFIPVMSGIDPIMTEIYQIKDLEEVGVVSAARIKNLSAMLERRLAPYEVQYCHEP